MEITEWVPEIATHAYWVKKEKFQYETDTYLTWVLFAVEEGRFEYQIGSDHGEAEFGDVVVCPPDVAFYRNTLTPLTFHAITFTFPTNEVHSPPLFDRKIRLSHIRRLSENYNQLKLADQALSYSWGNQIRKQHYFLDLWLMIVNQCQHHLDVNPSTDCDELIRAITLYLTNHAHESIEIQNVAHLFGLTPIALIRRFKNTHHMNPLQFLTSLRVKKAGTLLLQTDLKLDVIAEHCGYENGFYLSRVFSKFMGMSPSAFRKQNRF